MNYVIEDNIDFFAELNKLNISEQENQTKENNDNMCLLSHLPLTTHNITLPCNHSFNYIDLYNEIVAKRLKYNNYDQDKLQDNQTKCPYCRVIHNGLIPYIQLDGVKQLKKVNSPYEYVFDKYKIKCSYLLKSGKNKGQCCGLNGIKIKLCDNNEYELCITHKKVMEKSLLKLSASTTENIKEKKPKKEIVLTPEMKKFAKNYTIDSLKEIIKNYNNHEHSYFYSRLTGTKKELVKRIYDLKPELIALELFNSFPN